MHISLAGRESTRTPERTRESAREQESEQESKQTQERVTVSERSAPAVGGGIQNKHAHTKRQITTGRRATLHVFLCLSHGNIRESLFCFCPILGGACLFFILHPLFRTTCCPQIQIQAAHSRTLHSVWGKRKGKGRRRRYERVGSDGERGNQGSVNRSAH